MYPDCTTKTSSVWPTLWVKIACGKKWKWIGIFKPAEPNSPWDACYILSSIVWYRHTPFCCIKSDYQAKTVERVPPSVAIIAPSLKTCTPQNIWLPRIILFHTVTFWRDPNMRCKCDFLIYFVLFGSKIVQQPISIWCHKKHFCKLKVQHNRLCLGFCTDPQGSLHPFQTPFGGRQPLHRGNRRWLCRNTHSVAPLPSFSAHW